MWESDLFKDVPTRNFLLGTLFLAFVSCLAWALHARYTHALANVPGPFLASVTRLWYVSKVKEGQFDRLARDLHREYGPLVRIAPNEISVSDPDAMPIIYGSKSKFTKTDFYTPWRSTGFSTPHPDNFTNLDEADHSSRRRLVNNIYSMSSVLESEPYMNACTQSFTEQINRFADSGQAMDLGEWLQMYAFDIIGELYFGQAFGFVSTASDYGGLIEAVDVLLPILCVVAVLPIGFRTLYLLFGMLWPSVRKALPCMDSINAAAKEQVAQRQKILEAGKEKQTRRDLLAKLFEVYETKGSKEDFRIADIQQEAYVALVAGSDTTAIAMRSILYQLLKNPTAYDRAVAEIDQAIAEDRLTLPVKYADAIKLQYFPACVKEGMRLHPSIGLHLPRHVPKGGCQLSGRYIPEGWRVGINAAVLHYDPTVFGDDASQFNPDRWLQGDSSKMERHMFQFGGGSRTCLGKNISLAEMHKLLPQLLHEYHLELLHPKRPLKSYNWWFHKQVGLEVKVTKRRV